MSKLKRYIAIIILSASIGSVSSCTLWDIIKPASPGLQVDTELVVGDKNQTVQTELGQTNNTAESITIQNIKNTDYLLVAFALLGWILPTPSSMWEGVKSRWKKKKA